MKKEQLCTAIIARKARYDKDVAEGKNLNAQGEVVEAVSTAPKQRVIINRKRLLNVCFGDVIRPNLGERGRALTPEELTRGIKRGQVFFQSVVEEYNNPANYNNNEHPNITCGRSISPPSKFDPIVWQKAKSAFEDLTLEYEKCFNNWKMSGTHDDFENSVNRVATTESEKQKKPFIDFINRNYVLLYMHEFVYQYPDVLAKMIGEFVCLFVGLLFILFSYLCSNSVFYIFFQASSRQIE